MNKIWSNRLIAGTVTWSQVPESRKTGVKAELQSRVDKGIISQERMTAIVGTDAVADDYDYSALAQ